MSQRQKNQTGAFYYTQKTIHLSRPEEQYSYQVYAGSHDFQLEAGDTCFYVSEDKTTAFLARGPKKIRSSHFATVVRGYAPPERSAQLSNFTNLAYINACSARQVFSPERPGDPTWQMLKMPPHQKEQMHHIHPTARTVYVLSGKGTSVVGTGTHVQKQSLVPGMVCVLEPMCPHHFETTSEGLVVLPVHIWSSIEGWDFNHPMYHGTLRVDGE